MIAEWNPVTAVAEALRRHWTLGIIVVCASLALRAYQRAIPDEGPSDRRFHRGYAETCQAPIRLGIYRFSARY